MEKYRFDVEKCIEAKKVLNKIKEARNIYKEHCAPSKYIGNCSNLYQKLKPVDFLDFYEKELAYAEENKDRLPIYYRGLTYEDFYGLATKYKTMLEETCDVSYDLSIYFYSLVCHAIVETFVGQKKEEDIIRLLVKRGYNPLKTSGGKDARYGVDIAVNGISEDFYLQIKPISFFLSKFEDTNNDRISLCHKREEVLEMESIDTYYMIYAIDYLDSEVRWVTKDNGEILFHINELFQYEKDNIEETFVRVDLPRKQTLLDAPF